MQKTKFNCELALICIYVRSVCYVFIKKGYCFRSSCIYSTLKCSSILVCVSELQCDRLAKSIIHGSCIINIWIASILSTILYWCSFRNICFNPFACHDTVGEFQDFLFVFAYIWDLLADFKLEYYICPFVSFLQCEIIIFLSFIKRTDRFCFIDMAVGVVFT